MNDDQKFDPEAGFAKLISHACKYIHIFVFSFQTTRNIAVKDKLKKEVLLDKENDYSVAIINSKYMHTVLLLPLSF